MRSARTDAACVVIASHTSQASSITAVTDAASVSLATKSRSVASACRRSESVMARGWRLSKPTNGPASSGVASLWTCRTDNPAPCHRAMAAAW